MSTKDYIERAFSEEERELMLKDNKYYHTDKSEFDPVDILLEGKLPHFKTQGDKFRCVMAVAKFVRARKSIDGIEEGLVSFIKNVESDMRVIFMRNISLPLIEAMMRNEHFEEIMLPTIKDLL